MTMTMRDYYWLAWAGIEGAGDDGRRALRDTRHEIPADLAIPAFLRRELPLGCRYLGTGRDGEAVYRMPAEALEILAAAELKEWGSKKTRRAARG